MRLACRLRRSILAPLWGLLGLAGLVAAGCGGGEGGASRGATVDTLPSGRIVVTNPARGTTDLDGAWHVEVLARIGSREGGTPASFGSVVGVALDPLGRVWVADRQAKEIRVFDEDGGFVRTVGRAGGGPGEYSDLTGISRGPNGRMWAMDPKNARITVLDTAGEVASEHRVESAGFWVPCRCGFFGGSSWFEPVFTGSTIEDQAILVEDSTLTATDTLPVPSWPGGESHWTHTTRSGGKITGMTSVSIPFAPEARWTAGPRGHLWVGLGSPYRLLEVTPGSDTLREMDRAYEPVPVTSAERDSAIERLDYFRKQGGEIHEDQIPDHKPAIESLLVGEEGYVWVKANVGAGARPAWDVFDPEGIYLGAIHLPVALNPWATVITADRIVTVVRDEMDVPNVVVMRLERRVAGAGRGS